MTGLEQAFYIVALVYMGISLLLIIGMVTAVFIIRGKIVSLERTVQEKLAFVSTIHTALNKVTDLAEKITKHKSK